MEFTVTAGDVLVSAAGLLLTIQITQLLRDVRRLLGRVGDLERWAQEDFGFEPRAES